MKTGGMRHGKSESSYSEPNGAAFKTGGNPLQDRDAV